ncbi:glutathione S-transferase [Parapusillimonas granuli]|uniref:Glutathione S-transferase n=1 Tax=Parapusillimonas granuli TaxID=380911 RepID=A0A853G070_9BURK|nr:glutathione S-transferase [Parapusillimonas granuli]MBB5216695.1 glutathione S-transferase [Parapusillimonas granuli]MEB2400024.1 glutathione S-transferase [Alcaligenaceae bacterium]NYT51754.1 glutathione S-transferase [Parapusillimonas granuli]
MKIYFSPASPFVRKCMVVAAELGLAGQIEKLPSAANPVTRDQTIVATNPLGQVPTLLTETGQALYDSRVICEYLNHRGNGEIFPSDPARRWQALTEQSLADGILDAALLTRYEKAARPAEFQWEGWTKGQMEKIASGLGYFEKTIAGKAGVVDISTISLACALGYLDFRFPDYDWRASHPALAKWEADFTQRPSLRDSAPHA